MKTSKIIIITTACMVLALLITGGLLLRGSIDRYMESVPQLNFRAFTTESFSEVSFSDNFDVRIRQGREYKVELAGDEMIVPEPEISIHNGVLTVSAGQGTDSTITQTIHARITTRSLRVIRAADRSAIDMKNFQGDTLWIDLKDSCSFTGVNNRFRYVSVKTSGDAVIRLTDESEM